MFHKLTYRMFAMLPLLLLSATQQVIATEQAQQLAPVSQLVVEKLDVNKASNNQLAAIKGIGIKKAQAIIDYRQEHGDFSQLDQLMHVKGIGQATLEKIRPFITL